jgi:hypothetical protein
MNQSIAPKGRRRCRRQHRSCVHTHKPSSPEDPRPVARQSAPSSRLSFSPLRSHFRNLHPTLRHYTYPRPRDLRRRARHLELLASIPHPRPLSAVQSFSSVREPVDNRVPIRLAPVATRWTGNWAGWENREMLWFHAEPVSMLVNPPAFAGQRSIEEIAAVKLQSRFGRVNLHHPATELVHTPAPAIRIPHTAC